MPPRRPIPSQQQLTFPLLEVLDASGGRATTREVADALAARFHVDRETRERVVIVTRRAPDGSTREHRVNWWDRHVRWASMKAKVPGFLETAGKGLWSLTDAGKDGLRTARPGVVITVFETAQGVALWAKCEAAMQCIARGSVTLVCTSPEYPILRKKRYELDRARQTEAEYLDWLVACAREWYDLLSDQGTLMLNLGPAWLPGQAAQSLYRERAYLRLVDEIGFSLAQPFYWHSPSRLPGPAEWVNVRRVRVTDSVEHCYAFVKDPLRAKWDNHKVKVAYSDAMRAKLAAGGERARVKPSGHALAAGAFGRDNGGAIPKSLLSIAHTASNDAYLAHCRAHGMTPHPARMPRGLAEFFVRLTTDEGDLVYEPLGGSLTTADVCETLGRPWIASETSLTYLAGGASRFAGAPGFVDHAGLPGVARAA